MIQDILQSINILKRNYTILKYMYPMHAYIRINIHTYTYIHTHTHTHTYSIHIIHTYMLHTHFHRPALRTPAFFANIVIVCAVLTLTINKQLFHHTECIY